MDGQDEQDGRAGGFSVSSQGIAFLQPGPGNSLPTPGESLRRRPGSSRESASCATASRPENPVHPVNPCSIEPFAKFGRLRELLPGRVVPPGSAGVPPAFSSLAFRSVSPRCGTRPRCRRELHGTDRSRAMTPLPVCPGRGDGRGCAGICAGATPALPEGFPPLTSVFKLGAVIEFV